MLRTRINLDPVHEFRGLEEMFDRLFATPSRPVAGTATLPVDLTEADGKFFVRAAVPGVDPKDLDVTIQNNVLTISGESKHESTSDGERVYRREVSYGSFSRSVRLPEGLDFEHVEADFRNGMVSITLPRLPEEKPQTLKVPVRVTESAPSLESEAATAEA